MQLEMVSVSRLLRHQNIQTKHLFLIRRCYSAKALASGYKPKDVEIGTPRFPYQIVDGTKRPETLLLPPPNVTGHLHLGHALTCTVQDVLVRWETLIHKNPVIWVPGTDHAGIATQVVVEKTLLKERKLRRHDLGRNKFLEEIWKWRDDKGGRITDDLKKMCLSLDWSHEYFTLDEIRTNATLEAFIRLFESGFIYRGSSLVNWSCLLESAISDIEIDNLEIPGPTFIDVPGYEKPVKFGEICDIAYKIDGSEDELIVSTTRPETLLGDVAIAVNPNDERYSHLQNTNTTVWHPFRNESIPIVFDEAIDIQFGTGAVKVTPAHDKFDFDLAKRHNLKAISVINEKGKIVGDFEEFHGLQRFTARKKILNTLHSMNLLRGTKDHRMAVPICSRSKDVIEYLMKPQWFMKCAQLAKEALQEVEKGNLKIIPDMYQKDWNRWLSDCKDWCISRQLWWGHQIPAFKCSDGAKEVWVAAKTLEEAEEKAANLFGKEKGIDVVQDTDVLDTWFSSGLLPFSAFDWPSAKFKNHYPLSIMVTGHDILFFWVARMVMLGKALTNELPFKKVLLNGILCDSHGRKMSKSIGNVIQPHQVIDGVSLNQLQEEIKQMYQSGILSESEMKKSLAGQKKMFPKGIPECGMDALRFTLCSHNVKSHFINFDVDDCYANKLFFNKIWQASRYTLASHETLGVPIESTIELNGSNLTDMDRWILSKFANCVRQIHSALDQSDFHIATSALKTFFYGQFCDVYLETTKKNISQNTDAGRVHCVVLKMCLSVGLRYMSIFTPFLASSLLEHLPEIDLNLEKLMQWNNPMIEDEIGQILDICASIRQLKSQRSITKKHEPQVHLLIPSDRKEFIERFELIISTLIRVDTIKLHTNSDEFNRFEYTAKSTAGHFCTFGILSKELEQTAEKLTVDIVNLKKLSKLEIDLDKMRKTITRDGYSEKASQEVQYRHLERIKQLETEINTIRELMRG